MTIEQAEEIFDDYGYASLFQHLRYPLIASGELKDVPVDLLSCFFEWYSFEMNDVPFAEFMYHFLIFKKIYMNHHFPFMGTEHH